MSATKIAEILYSLDEPWRTRFLILVAKMATKQQWGSSVPNRNQVIAWLERDASLQRQMRHMLGTWGKRC